MFPLICANANAEFHVNWPVMLKYALQCCGTPSRLCCENRTLHGETAKRKTLSVNGSLGLIASGFVCL